MAKKHHEEEHENHERWLVTYADMITLLMVLFIVLYSISQVDLAKFAKLKAGLGSAAAAQEAGVLEGGKSLEQGNTPVSVADSNGNGTVITASDGTSSGAAPTTTTTAAPAAPGSAQEAHEKAYQADQAALAQTKTEIEQQLSASGLAGAASLKIEARGLVVAIVTDKVLFDSGSDQIKTEGEAVLGALAPAFKELPNQLSIEGHTDNVPIATSRFASNWELSTARATTVLRVLVEHDGLDPTHVSAAGYADQRPIASNDSPDGRSANRRVEIVVRAMVSDPNADGTTSPQG
jgi:chemotaxis protein MotB